jgi:peptide chain release factor 1
MDYLEKTIDELDRKIEENKNLLSDPSLSQLAAEEISKLESEKRQFLSAQESQKEPSADKNSVIVEIRAAAGGNEAGLFAGNLYRMYTRYADSKGWNCQQISINEGGIGNIKEVIFRIEGEGSFEKLKYESGVHRVQRVPVTESSGRIHTSTTTIAVLPEVTESEFHIDPKDLKIETYRASGHGGQNVQKVETAVRITHTPTGLVVICQSERSQFQNKERAISVLRSRLYEAQRLAGKKEVDYTRKEQLGTGDRSEKIRTYNFPQDRITDHRAGKSWHHIEDILNGNLDPIVNTLQSNPEQK